MGDLFIENFKGIRGLNHVVDVFSSGTISAVNCCNVDLKNSDNSANVSICTTKGNKLVKDIGKTVIGQFFSVQNGVAYWYIYAVDETRGYLYTYDASTDELEDVGVELSINSHCNGITISQGFDDWFVFTNGVDDYLGICPARELSEDRVKFLNAIDAEGREIRGLGLEIQDGRLVTFCKNRVHWSAQANIFDWISSDPDIITSPAYQEFDRDVTAIVYYNNSLVAFTNDYSVSFTGNPGNAANFARSGASGGGCPSYKAVMKFDNKLFYYDHVARNVFAYYLLDSGQTRPTEGLANDVIAFLNKIFNKRLQDLELISYIYGNKNEIWFKLPFEERNAILIYDYLNHEWTERREQDDIRAFMVVEGSLYSASGSKILKEYVSSTFDGNYIPSEYKMNVINVGSDSNIKVPKMPLILTLDYEYENDFYIEFVYDDIPDKSRKKHIVKLTKGYLIWAKSYEDEGGGCWAHHETDPENGIWVSSEKNTVMFNLDGVMHFKQLQIRIYTKEKPQEFAIKRLELKRVRLKTKSLG